MTLTSDEPAAGAARAFRGRRLAAALLGPIHPVVAGILIAVIAVVAGALVLSPPADYGLCTTCHARDLAVGLVQQVAPAIVDAPVFFPMLTTLGILAGAWLARRASGERIHADPRPTRSLVATRVGQGFLAVSFALLAMGCPIRLTLRASDLAVEGIIGLTGVAFGIWAGVRYLRERA